MFYSVLPNIFPQIFFLNVKYRAVFDYLGGIYLGIDSFSL